MQKFDPKIFRSYDIRGKYPKEINGDFAFQFGCLLPKIIKSGKKPRKIIIAADDRFSSAKLKSQFVAGLLQNKISVIDAGSASAPMLYLGVKQTQSDLGVIITASHLGKAYSGFKICQSDLQIIGGTELKKNINLFFRPINRSSQIGKYQKKNLLNDYVKFLMGKADFSQKELSYSQKIKIEVLRPASTVKSAIKELARRTKLKISFGNAKRNKSDFTVGFDSDEDRIFFFDPSGQKILGDAISAAITDCLLQKHKGEAVIIDERSSYLINEVVRKNKGKIFYSRVGHKFFKKEMAKRKAVFGGEKTGHYYWQELHYIDSGIFTLLRLLKCLALQKMSFANLMKNYQKYATLAEQNFKITNPEEKLNSVRRHFQKQSRKISLLDGLTMQFNDWRFNLRQSETESLLRLNIEAVSKSILIKKLQEIKRILKK